MKSHRSLSAYESEAAEEIKKYKTKRKAMIKASQASDDGEETDVGQNEASETTPASPKGKEKKPPPYRRHKD